MIVKIDGNVKLNIDFFLFASQASATRERGSKRKSTPKPVEGAGKSPKKTTPSPYNKRLRKQSRK